MALHPLPPIDIRNLAINGRFLRRLIKLAKPFWWRRAAWPWHLALLVLCLLIGSYTAIGAWSSFVIKDQTDALVAKDMASFRALLGLSCLLVALRFISSAVQGYLDGLVNLHWRRWLTTYMVDLYLQRRTYFAINQNNIIDNPDQRIQEEIGPFCTLVSLLPRQLFGSALDMSVQAAILMTISPQLFWAVVAFAAIKTVLMIWLYKPTIRQSYEITVAEADLRYGLLHVRDHAETVALYHGEAAERRHILERLGTAFRKGIVQNLYQVWLTLAYGGFSLLWTALPLILLAPLYFADEIGYGSIAQGTAAAASLLAALTILLNFLPIITSTVPKVVRLAEILEKFEELGMLDQQSDTRPRIAITAGTHVQLRRLRLETPGGEQQLIRDLDLDILPGRHTIIMGRTGSGKSSLLRAMAGLWTRGDGSIAMPPADELLFLPQKPYMVLADLRTQLLYPSYRQDLQDQDLLDILARVGLPELAGQHGGLDAVKDWSRVLSLGEQQRIAFARLLIARPRYVFLDEATSAVDVDTERLLYRLLERSGATFVSVAHRASLVPYHVQRLHLQPDGSWQLEQRPADAISLPALQPVS